MDGTAELLQLAHLLRVTANTARDIATIRRLNSGEIDALARQAEKIADDFEKIARMPLEDGRSDLAKSG